MAVLSDQEIWSLLDSKRLIIDPRPDLDAVSPSAVDLRLGKRFTRLKNLPSAMDQSVDTRNSAAVMEVIASLSEEVQIDEGKPFVLEPDRLVLAWTLERIGLPNFLCARVEGRSTLARIGLSVHQTAPTIHATFDNPLQLELYNAGPYPLKLYPGQSICQLIIETLSLPSSTSLRSIHTSGPSG